MEQTNPENDLIFSPEDFTPEEIGGETEKAEPEVIKEKIKYNGKEEEYTLEELKTLAQKGRNYDHVLGERDELKKYSDEVKTLAELAKEAGKEPKVFLEELRNNFRNEKLQKRVQELQEEGMKPEHAQRMAEMELNQPRQAVEEEQAQDPTHLVNEFQALFKKFPETAQFKDLSEFPEEVQTLIQEGESPLVAYMQYKMSELEKAKSVEAQNKDAQQRDTGSFKTGKSEEKEDEFLQGLLK